MKGVARFAAVGLIVLPIVMFIFGVVLVCLAFGQELPHKDHPQDIQMHLKFYSNWYRPEMRNRDGERQYSCCNMHDCYPTEFHRENGKWYYHRREDGGWYRVPETVLEHNQPDARDSPDGRGHVCANPTTPDMVYCAVLGIGT